MATFLVTGGAGFIGSNITQELLKRGDTVRVLDDFSTGREENIRDFMSDIELIEGDIRDKATVQSAMKGVDYVLHQAALASVQRSIDNPEASNEVNVRGTLNLLDAANGESVKRFVYASSSSVYGDSEVLPKEESMPTNPKSPYAVTKLAGELYCQVYSGVFGLPTVSLRYFNVFGPKQDPNSQYSAVIPIFIKALIQNEPPTIFGDGEQSRDFTFVENVVRANLLACESNSPGGGVYNVACGDRFTLNDLYARLMMIIGSNIEPKFGPPRPGDVKHSQASIRAVEEALGYRTVVDFENGLERTVQWYREVGLKTA
ncbi:MAG: NAD-dependent epimerase/dehydratase family protein [Candidatus Latescibacteria bacterium]|nr:NAD-dependent epimerase/dehydratase family protein [Candidatus Latescibacterota bacterium]NIM21509.1 NAD-dependent epimerase/dehydratase family protein [Candidatus Latescibacterota bacterium]NIM65680.1 NAD-dependent epimerase/dehydratase family protein [Candidatus Latescibacterota bacterium]NIO02062.1 NAD-dependent epimerase/dehydratase family protein [Candidatus Latescibacterota bacterium]NIO28874.1 NAD-dependent epimerase/dehydratase family protein [Candidatus Latescibacterota bacterium]